MMNPRGGLYSRICCPRGEESMSLGSRIVAVGGIQSGGLVPKAG